jgi:AraC family transcriptional regulator
MHPILSYGKFIGARRREIKTAGFCFAEIIDQTDSEVPRHMHEDAHFCFILQGIYITNTRNKEHLCSTSTMLFHPAGTTHRDRFYSRGGRFFTVSLTRDTLEHVQDHLDLVGHSLALPDHLVEWLGSKLYRELQTKDDLSSIVMEGMAFELLAYTLRREMRPTRERPRWLRMAHELMRDRCGEHITISEIAKSVGVHPFHLSRTFREFYRCSPGEFLRSCRIETASDLLKGSDLPLAEVALQSGFSDQSQFTKSFKRKTGMTPREFRNLFGS